MDAVFYFEGSLKRREESYWRFSKGLFQLLNLCFNENLADKNKTIGFYLLLLLSPNQDANR